MSNYNHAAEDLDDALGLSIEELFTKADVIIKKIEETEEEEGVTLSRQIEMFEKGLTKQELATLCILSKIQNDVTSPDIVGLMMTLFNSKELTKVKDVIKQKTDT